MSQAAPGNLIALFSAAAGRHGSRTALQQSGRVLTYGELLSRAHGFAACLRQHGVTPGSTVAMLTENSLDYAVALLGIWAAGAVAVPLNPEVSADSARSILRNCSARLVVARNRVLARLNPSEEWPETIALAAAFEENLHFFAPAASAPVPAQLESDALVLYTSGTTGDPKGVVLTHGNLLANTLSIVQYLNLTAEDSTVTVLPFFHSFGNSVLLTHLAVGAKIVIENRFAFPNQVVQTMQAVRPTGFSGVPTTFYILMQKTTFLKQDWSFLRYVSQAGGAMRMETVLQLRQALGGADIYIMYGQTEASARLSYVPPAMLKAKLGSIGKAIPGVELRVVDAEGRPAAVGEIGEIVARGPNIMRGYLNDPEGTAEVLREGWLHTRDMARLDQDGFIYVVSRRSDFIKSAAFRISPGEIEEVICAAAPEVEDVAVIGVPDELLGEAIAACVSCPGPQFDGVRIRNLCLERLPLYKVPKYVVHEPDIPRTASGKKLYSQLREKYRDLPAVSS